MEEYNKEREVNNLVLTAFAKAWIQSNMKPFTSDDIKIAFFKRYPNFNAKKLPNIFNELRRVGVIKPTGDYVKSRFKIAHGRPVRIWISQVYSNKQRAKRESNEARIRRESLEEMDLFKNV